jgi:very-short-patch-repair endonuclease
LQPIELALARAEKQYGAIAFHQALACGMTADDVYRQHEKRLWVPMHVGVSRVSGTHETWHTRLMAATLAGGDPVVASRRAAAALWRITGFPAGIVEVTLPHALEYAPRGVVAHRTRCLPAIDRTTKDRIPVTTPTRTLIDLASCTNDEHLIDAIDDSLRRGLTTVKRIEDRLTELGRPGRKGIKMLRELLLEYTPGEAVPASVFERRLLRILRRSGIQAPTVHLVVTVMGTEIEVDFGWPEQKVILEANGSKWHDTQRRSAIDDHKRALLAAAGWRIVPVRWATMRNHPQLIVRLIRAALA